MPKDVYSVPKSSKGDVAHALVKATLSAVPVAGGPGAELFHFLLQTPLEKRREEWMHRVAGGLTNLETKGLNLESLRDNDEFVSVVMHASQIALRTHQEEKLEALRNAVLNVADREAPEEALQLMFLNFVDVFTEWHLRILKSLKRPRSKRTSCQELCLTCLKMCFLNTLGDARSMIPYGATSISAAWLGPKTCM